MKLKSKFLQISQCQMKSVTTEDNRKNPEYHVVAAMRPLTDKTVPQIHWFGHDFSAGQFLSVRNGYGRTISRPADYFITCYTVLTRPNKVETGVHDG